MKKIALLVGTLVQAQISFAAAPATILYSGPTALYPSLQAAVTAVRSGGTVKIAPGLYNEPSIQIAGKTVHIVGLKSGSQVAQIKLTVGSEVFHIDSKANVSISNLFISGGTYGIRSLSVDASDAPNISLANVTVSGNKYGFILLSARNVTLTNCHASGNNVLGLYLSNFEAATVRGGDYSQSGGFGIAINAVANAGQVATGTAKLIGVTVADNRAGGISVFGAAKPVSITNSVITGNLSQGILAASARLTVTGSHLSYNNRSFSGDFGDGIISLGSMLTLSRDSFVENDRNGVSVISCSDTPAQPVSLKYSASLFDYNRGDSLAGYLDSSCNGTVSVSELPGRANLCRDGNFNGNQNCALHETGMTSDEPGYVQ